MKKMTDDELRAAHDKLDGERAEVLVAFKIVTAENKAYLEQYKSEKQALPRRPQDEESDGEVTA